MFVEEVITLSRHDYYISQTCYKNFANNAGPCIPTNILWIVIKFEIGTNLDR